MFTTNSSTKTGFRTAPYLEIWQYNETGQVGEWLGGEDGR